MAAARGIVSTLRRGVVPLAVLALAALVLALACGDGGGGNGDERLGPQEYFQRLTVIQDDFGKRMKGPFEAYLDVWVEAMAGETPDEEKLEAARRGQADIAEAASYFRAALAELSPPRQAEDAHRELLAAWDDIQAAHEERADQVRSVKSAEELIAVMGPPVDEEAGQRALDACLALQSVANDDGIEVDLLCQDEE